MDFLSKADLQAMYDCKHPEQFGKLIGEEGRKILNWKPGRQRFTPIQIRKLYEKIGAPLTRAEKYGG